MSKKHPGDSDLLALLDTLFESAPIGLAFVDRDFRYVRINQWLAEINGKSVDEHVGKTVKEMQPGIATPVLETYRRVLETGEPSIDQELNTATRSFLASHFAVRDKHGHTLGVGVVVQEITDEKEARADADNERQRLRSIFMQAPAAIAMLRGPNHIYELSNPANNLGLGIDPTGKPIREALPEVTKLGYDDILDRVYKYGERFQDAEAPLLVRGPDGEPRTAYVNGFYEPMRNAAGEIDGVMVFGFEVTEQVLARRRAEAAEREARAAVQLRDDFLSIAGHELRTPLTALKLYLQSLAAGLKAEGPGDLRERVGKVTAQAARLERLVTELLDVSRITSGHLGLHCESTDLTALAQDVLDRFRNVSDSSIVLHAPQSVEGHWDPSRLDQVLTNLVGNAVKYGDSQPIEVSIVREGEMVRLTVRDHGIGIEPEAQARVFERFERAKPDSEYGGLGVGLWIAREIVTAHGGRIRLHSKLDQGTTVEVELPIGKS